jgi:flagellar hook-associated protein 2
MASPISFQGLSTGLQTDALISAILTQEGKSVEGLQARQTRNAAKTAALTSMKSGMNALIVSLAALQDKLAARTVTSTDANNTNVTATASGAASGNYDLKVTTVATKGRISPTLVGGVPQNLAVANPATAIFSSASASFAVQGTDGVIKAFQLTDNSLTGLKNAINASGAGVSASIINTGTGTNPYQLVITAKDTGTGTTSGVVTLAAITNADSTVTTVDPALGITTGSLTGTFASPTAVTGGISSSTSGSSASDAVFSLNGIQLTRKTNVVGDAADGVVFTLKQGGQTGTTTLTVAQDKATATAGMQDLVTKFNALLKTYKDAATSTKDTNGTVLPGALAGDATSRTIISQIRSTLMGASAGLPGSSSFQNPASLGLKTNVDGTLSLNTSTFQTAIEKDPTAVMRLFTFSGDSNNGVVAFKGAGAKTATGAVGFTISNYIPGGTFTATFTGTANTVPPITGSNGSLVGTGDLDGLSLAVTGNGSGTLTLVRGAGQAVSDLINQFNASGSGSLATSLTNITNQNKSLATQIDAGQSALDRRKKVLQAQFAKMEIAIGQLKAAGGSLTVF